MIANIAAYEHLVQGAFREALESLARFNLPLADHLIDGARIALGVPANRASLAPLPSEWGEAAVVGATSLAVHSGASGEERPALNAVASAAAMGTNMHLGHRKTCAKNADLKAKKALAANKERAARRAAGQQARDGTASGMKPPEESEGAVLEPAGAVAAAGKEEKEGVSVCPVCRMGVKFGL